MNCLVHRPVEGFGFMGDGYVCAKCGLDKYPEAFPFNRLPAITSKHSQYQEWVRLATAAREARIVRDAS